MNIQPLGYKIIALPIAQEEHKTEGGVIGVETTVQKAKVVEFSQEFSGVYNKGDIILIPKGVGNGTLYNGEPHLFLDGRGAPIGDVWALVIE